MKKKLFIFILLCSFQLINCYSFAQQKTQEHKWQLGIQVNTIDKLPSVAGIIDGQFILFGHQKDKSYSLGLFGNYSLSSNVSLRLKIDYTNRKIIEDAGNIDSINSPVGVTIEHNDINQKIYTVAPGVKFMSFIKPFEIYCGFELLYVNYGNLFINYYADTYSNNIKNSRELWNVKAPNGYGIGSGAFLGFEIPFLRHFTLGSELSYSYSYLIYNKGITKRTESLYHYYPSGPTEINNDTYDDTIENIGAMNLVGCFHISFMF